MGNNPVIGVDPDGRDWEFHGHQHYQQGYLNGEKVGDPIPGEIHGYWYWNDYPAFSSANNFQIQSGNSGHFGGGNGGSSNSHVNYSGGVLDWGNSNPSPTIEELIDDALNYIKTSLGFEDVIYYGTSIDVTLCIPAGYSVEYGQVIDPNTGEKESFYSYGSAFGLESSAGLNFLFLIPKDSFIQSDFYGTSQGFNFSTPWFSGSISGNSTQRYSGDTIFDSYYLVKIGYGIGAGFSYNPRSRTKP